MGFDSRRKGNMKAILICVVVLFGLMGGMTVATASKSNESLAENRNLPTIAPIIPLTVSSPALVIARKNPNQKKDKIGNVINFLKTYPVSKILPGLTNVPHRKLPEIPLEKWLTSLFGDTLLEWKGGDCVAYDSDVGDGETDGCTLFSVEVSTLKTHCPSVELRFGIDQDTTVHLMYEGSEVNDFGAHGSLEQLADLEKKLNEVKSKTVSNRPSSPNIDRLRARKGTDFALYAAGLDVSRLDPSLPSERFDKWLERISGWPFQWTTMWRAAPGYFHPCQFTEIEIHVFPVIDAEGQFPPVSITMVLGSWEEEIKSEPELHLYATGTAYDRFDRLKNLSALKNEIDAWKVAPKPKLVVQPKPVIPEYKPTLPLVKNLTPLGVFSRMRTTPSWHCYGHILSLWKYGDRLFGTHHDLGGQCADSREPTYIVRDVKFDPKTGKLEFWSYGIPGNKFVGKMKQDLVTGEFLGNFDEEKVKLKRGKDDGEPLLDSNIEFWCKGYAPLIQNIVEKELEELCKSLGVK